MPLDRKPRRIGEDTARARQRRETRLRILAAARELFLAQGFEATAMRDVARQAGIAVGSIFAHFPSKADLLLELAGEMNERTFDHLEAAMPPNGPIASRIRQFLEVCYRFDLADIGIVRLVHSLSWLWTDATEERHASQLQRGRSFMLRLVEEARANGEMQVDLDPKVVVAGIAALYDAVLRKAVACGQADDPAELVRRLDPFLALVFVGLVEDQAGSSVSASSSAVRATVPGNP